jgi:hypothetical protein
MNYAKQQSKCTSQNMRACFLNKVVKLVFHYLRYSEMWRSGKVVESNPRGRRLKTWWCCF